MWSWWKSVRVCVCVNACARDRDQMWMMRGKEEIGIFREDFFISYRSAIHHFHQQLKIHLNLDISFFVVVVSCTTLLASKLHARHHRFFFFFSILLTMCALLCFVYAIYSWICHFFLLLYFIVNLNVVDSRFYCYLKIWSVYGTKRNAY